MNQSKRTTIRKIDITALCELLVKPPIFAPGEAHFWTDPHIARQMLAAHLNPDTDAASRRPDTIQRSTGWIVRTLALQAGDSLLDLGCGPGLYATRLALHGLHVTGVDFSQTSIEYARADARRNGLEITYCYQDYLELKDECIFDAALLIYGDLCPLSPEQRSRLLSNVWRALKPGGRFVLDVSTPHLRQREGLKNSWYAVQVGFWKPGPHLVLEQGFAYPEDIYLDQYIVVDTDGKISVYRNWFQDYTARTIRAELEASGFTVQSLWSDLIGTPYAETSDWIGIVASKPGQTYSPTRQLANSNLAAVFLPDAKSNDQEETAHYQDRCNDTRGAQDGKKPDSPDRPTRTCGDRRDTPAADPDREHECEKQ